MKAIASAVAVAALLTGCGGGSAETNLETKFAPPTSVVVTEEEDRRVTHQHKRQHNHGGKKAGHP